jgi:hypothetical protein
MATAFGPFDQAGDELAADLDPYACVECLGLGDSCEFHTGFAAGWDACVSLMASAIEEAA